MPFDMKAGWQGASLPASAYGDVLMVLALKVAGSQQGGISWHGLLDVHGGCRTPAEAKCHCKLLKGYDVVVVSKLGDEQC
eukprot:1156689-Pelagomonas_calceolata.AAC.3